MNTTKAVSAYTDKKIEALELIAKIQAGINADEYDPAWAWANYGTMEHYVNELQAISDQIYNEGDYENIDN